MIRITVAYATPLKQEEVTLDVETESTVLSAIHQSGLLQIFPEIDLNKAKVGIHGRLVLLTDSLKQNDRVEIYRPLLLNPNEARLLRAKRAKKKMQP